MHTAVYEEKKTAMYFLPPSLQVCLLKINVSWPITYPHTQPRAITILCTARSPTRCSVHASRTPLIYPSIRPSTPNLFLPTPGPPHCTFSHRASTTRLFPTCLRRSNCITGMQSHNAAFSVCASTPPNRASLGWSAQTP